MANSYLERTPSGAGSRRKWTISFWVKRSKLGVQTPLISTVQSSPANTYDEMYFNTSDKFQFSTVYNNSQKAIRTSRVFRDTNAWYHIVFSYDTANSTDTDHAKLWINGVRETVFEDTTLLASGANDWDSSWNNSGNPMRIGYQSTNTASYFYGYMSHIAFVNDTVVAPTVFGETDSTSGIWKFKSPSGVTWGTNGFHLKMENSGALGTDSSGQSSTFTVNGNLRQSIDTPSNVYPTLNVLAQTSGNTQIDNGSLTFHMTSDAGQRMYLSTLGADTGKWYYEAKLVAKGNTGGSVPYIGAFAYKNNTNTYVGSANGVGYNINGNVYVAASDLGNSGTSYDNGDIIGCALDITNSKIYFHKNGTYINSGNPSSGSNGYNISSITAKGTLGLAVSLYDNNGNWDLNYGAGLFGKTAISSAGSNGNGSLFEYDVPTGFYALNTKNINTYG